MSSLAGPNSGMGVLRGTFHEFFDVAADDMLGGGNQW